MRVRFIAQPFGDGSDLRDFLVMVLADQSITALDIAVAWAKRSGLRIVENDIRAFRGRGGRVRMVIGISEGGATKQGLELAMDLTDEVYIFHNPGRTFHPKVYAAYGNGTAKVLVGSHNLTAGGAVRNFEAGTLCELSLESPDDKQYLESVVNLYFERLIDYSGVCVKLDTVAFEAIKANVAYRVGDEDAPRTSSIGGGIAASQGDMDNDSVTDDQQTSQEKIFSKSKHHLRSTSSNMIASKSNLGRRTGSTSNRAPFADPANFAGNPVPLTTGQVAVKRWYKKMSRADAQRPSAGTNPTGHLTLTKSRFPIDHTTYFRKVFFGDAKWIPISSARGNRREEASIPIEVIIRGSTLGVQTLSIDYYPNYEADQGNRTTLLHWGDTLNLYLRQHDLVGDYATLEKLGSESYRLIIDSLPNEPFVP